MHIWYSKGKSKR